MMIERLRHGLIVSCQPVPGGPFDDPASVVRFALAARDAGAVGLRIEGAANVLAVRSCCDLPVIGLIKRDLDDSPVRITPRVEDVAALAEAGAAIIAFDATDRVRPVPVVDLLAAVRAQGCLAMADIATLDEARAAQGFDLVGTTMSGYTAGPTPETPDLALVRHAAALGRPVIAEGRYNQPGLAAAALRAGAFAVVVGSAITRPEHVTTWFRAAMAQVETGPVLALDIGGSKIAAALVQNGRVLARAGLATDPQAGPDAWLAGIAGVTRAWRGGFGRVGAAVSGLVREGRWSAANSATLPVPDGFPLTDRLRALFDVDACACNDAQAAAWGEHRWGAGEGRDLLFLTVSSGIGGGVVSQGRLLTGSAGHVGQMPVAVPGGVARLEDVASGFAMARRAGALGHAADAREVHARRGEAWADQVWREAIAALALVLPGLQAVLDPALMVIGGGVGLAEGYLPDLVAAMPEVAARFRPRLVPARLAGDAGLIGIADLAG